MTMRNGNIPSKHELPAFDEAILNPVGDEIVRAVHTRPNQEVVLEKFCRSNGIVCYLPVRRAVKVHNIIRKGVPHSYSKEVLRSMFPSYIFVKLPSSLMRTIHDANIFARVVPMQYDQKKLLDEIKVVRACEEIGFVQKLEVHKEILEGERFRILSGVWDGAEGRLTTKDDVFKWTVEIEIFSQYVTTVIDPTQYKMIPLD